MGENYERLVFRISEAAKISIEEIERKVEAKRAKLSGLVSREGAAQIVAAELGINFDQERLKIAEIVHGMRRANVVGKIVEVYPVREYNKNGREGKVCNLLVADESSSARTVLWDVHHIELIEKEKLKKGDVIEISNANVRNGELHLSSFSDIKKSKELLDKVVEGRIYSERKIADIKPGENFRTRAVIVQVFEPRYFEVCPKCGKKIVDGKCSAGHENVEGKKRALLNLVVDDGSGSVRGVLFGESINKLGLSNEEIFSLEKFALSKINLLGDEKYFSGNMRSNQLYNTSEFVIDEVLEINPAELIKSFENKG